MQDSSLYPDDFRRYLTEIYESRSARNPSYSMRAFARDLGIGVSTLNETLKGKYGFSKPRIAQVTKALQLSEEQSQHFTDLVQKQHSRDATERHNAELRIQDRINNSTQSLALDGFKIISDWYHLALLELLSLEDSSSDLKWLSKKMGLPQITISEALNRLERLDLIKQTKKGLKPTQDFSSLCSETPSEVVRTFHKQILAKAIAAIDLQTFQERDNSAMIFAINKKDLPLAKKKIVRFRRDFSSLLAKSDGKDDVYCLGINFFSLLEKGDTQ